jgi:hypothetical protein
MEFAKSGHESTLNSLTEAEQTRVCCCSRDGVHITCPAWGMAQHDLERRRHRHEDDRHHDARPTAP